jgi:hypothetical protein
MKFALLGALTLACLALVGCGVVAALAPPLETGACAALEATAAARTACINVAGALTTVGEDLAGGATANVAKPAPAPSPAAAHSK